MIEFFKKLFGKRKSSGNEERNGDDDYMIKKSKSADIIIAILSLVCAIIIWVYVVSSGSIVIG